MFSLLLGLALASPSAAAGPPPGGGPTAGPGGPPRPPPLPALIVDAATDAHMDKGVIDHLRALADAQRGHLDQLREEAQAAREELHEVVDGDLPRVNELLAASRALGDAEEELRETELRLVADMAASLGEDGWAMVTEHLRKLPPPPGGGAGRGGPPGTEGNRPPPPPTAG